MTFTSYLIGKIIGIVLQKRMIIFFNTNLQTIVLPIGTEIEITKALEKNSFLALAVLIHMVLTNPLRTLGHFSYLKGQVQTISIWVSTEVVWMAFTTI